MMVQRFFAAGFCQAGIWVRASLGLVVVAGLCTPPPAPAQGGWFSRHQKAAAPESKALAKSAVNPSQPPAFAIPVEPLGFFAPGAIYQGERESLVSLDFLDENRLLFTFHAPGLIRRAGDPTINGDERQIRAIVLSLPNGTITAEALWTLHDRTRYLWMLNDGHFLLRDQGDLQLGDASLELKPSFHFPGPLLWLEMDPTQQMMVTDSREPADSKAHSGDVLSPATASATVTSDAPPTTGEPDIVLRILRRVSGRVMLVSHVRTTVHLPINSDGYVESLRSTKGHEWILNLNYFTGGRRIIGKLDSTCTPALEFISNGEVLATNCNPDGSRWMVAMTTDGRRLWNAASPPTQIWPRLVMAPSGLRLARETLTVTHRVDAFSPLSFDDVKGQLIEVYDAASGTLALSAPASPVLDGGGNIAISPTGNRVAVLNAGAIQVFELPAPAPMPSSDGKPAVR
jgi:hypothetical protein